MAGRWRSFGVVSVAVFITVLDLFIVNIAMPDLRREFTEASLSGLSWVINAYTIAFAALLVPFGKLGDLFGRRRVFQLGLLTFTLASALAALAPSVQLLIAARFLQGVGAAALTPNSLGLLLPLFPAGERATAIGAWAAIAGVGAAMGPPLGGLLVEASWRWIFLVNIPLGLLAAALAQRRFGEVRERGAAIPDGLGAGLIMLGIGLLTLGLVQGPDWGWDWRAIASFALAGVLLAALIVRSGRHRAPVLELELFRSPSFSLACAATAIFFAGFAPLLLASPLFLTDLWGYSALEAGLAFAPGPAMTVVAAVISGRLADRYSPAIMGLPGGLLFAIGTAWFIFSLGTEPSYLANYLPAVLIGGTGVGLILPSFTAVAVMTLPPARLATGIAAETAFRQTGAALGIAAWIAVVGTPVAAEALTAYDRGWALMAACSLAGGLVMGLIAVLVRRGRGRRLTEAVAPASPPLTEAAE